MLHFIGLGFGLFVLLFYLLYNDFFFLFRRISLKLVAYCRTCGTTILTINQTLKGN